MDISLAKFIALLLPYLVILIFGLVSLLSLATIYLRFTLYKHLVYLEKRVRRLINRGERGNQPEIIQELERRFKEASSNLDHVNTAALIDQVYSREKVLFLSCEQIDYLCRNIPNLLIAFGLLGTFIGITVNLTSLSQSISQTNSNDVTSLVRELQEPLKGMGIAFTTSLAGILCSALLTIFNLIFNTNISKLARKK
jgi:biopolymer transport protein ExbB/TolQ